MLRSTFLAACTFSSGLLPRAAHGSRLIIVSYGYARRLFLNVPIVVIEKWRRSSRLQQVFDGACRADQRGLRPRSAENIDADGDAISLTGTDWNGNDGISCLSRDEDLKRVAPLAMRQSHAREKHTACRLFGIRSACILRSGLPRTGVLRAASIPSSRDVRRSHSSASQYWRSCTPLSAAAACRPYWPSANPATSPTSAPSVSGKASFNAMMSSILLILVLLTVSRYFLKSLRGCQMDSTR